MPSWLRQSSWKEKRNPSQEITLVAVRWTQQRVVNSWREDCHVSCKRTYAFDKRSFVYKSSASPRRARESVSRSAWVLKKTVDFSVVAP